MKLVGSKIRGVVVAHSAHNRERVKENRKESGSECSSYRGVSLLSVPG